MFEIFPLVIDYFLYPLRIPLSSRKQTGLPADITRSNIFIRKTSITIENSLTVFWSLASKWRADTLLKIRFRTNAFGSYSRSIPLEYGRSKSIFIIVMLIFLVMYNDKEDGLWCTRGWRLFSHVITYYISGLVNYLL